MVISDLPLRQEQRLVLDDHKETKGAPTWPPRSNSHQAPGPRAADQRKAGTLSKPCRQIRDLQFFAGDPQRGARMTA